MINFLEKIKQLVQKSNLAARIICLGCAVMLWVYVASTKKGEVTVRVPIEFRNIPASAVLVKKQFKSITVVLSGKNEDVKSVDVKNLKAYVNLENAILGQKIQYPIELNKSVLPDTISIDVSQQKVFLTIGKRVYKRVRIVPRIVGSVKDGYALGTIRLIPDYCIISGAETHLSKIDSIYTNKISVDNLMRRVIKEIDIDSESHNELIVDTPRVTAVIPVIESAGMLNVEIHPRVRTLSERYDFTIREKSVILYYRPLQEGLEISTDELEAFADVAVPEAGFIFGDTEDYIEKTVPVVLVFRNRLKRELVRPVITVPDTVVVKITKK